MADLEILLQKTSRTFALNIPLLPQPTRREVTIAYLLFRIADTFEDADLWAPEQRIAALDGFSRLLEEPVLPTAERMAKEWMSPAPTDHAGYQELIREVPSVFEQFLELSPAAREMVRRHTVRTAAGMARFVGGATANGALELKDLQHLYDYCYVVAGIVGEMLTELFLLEREPLAPVAASLRARSVRFGEGLQLTNILKDANRDEAVGRCYLPAGIDAEQVFRRAREDLHIAREYTVALQEGGAPRGLVAFNALPVMLAWSTLDRVAEEGPGAKLSRPEVYGIVAAMNHALDNDRPAVSYGSADRSPLVFKENR